MNVGDEVYAVGRCVSGYKVFKTKIIDVNTNPTYTVLPHKGESKFTQTDLFTTEEEAQKRLESIYEGNI